MSDRHSDLVELTLRAAVTACTFVGQRLHPAQIEQISKAIEQGIREARRQGRVDPRATPPGGTPRLDRHPTVRLRRVQTPPPPKDSK